MLGEDRVGEARRTRDDVKTAVSGAPADGVLRCAIGRVERELLHRARVPTTLGAARALDLVGAAEPSARLDEGAPGGPCARGILSTRGLILGAAVVPRIAVRAVPHARRVCGAVVCECDVVARLAI